MIDHALAKHLPRSATDSLRGGHVPIAISIFLASTLSEPVREDVKSTLGPGIWNHPAMVWIVLYAIVLGHTGNWYSGFVVLVCYEAIKALTLLARGGARAIRLRVFGRPADVIPASPRM